MAGQRKRRGLSDDITSNYHGGNPRSVEAHRSARERKEADFRRILTLLHKTPRGLICDEAEIILGMSHQTCSARFSELKAKEWIETRSDGQGDTVQRQTRTGCWADVMFFVRKAEAA